MLSIVQAPASVLSTPAKRIGKIDKDIKNIINDMTDALVKATSPEGIGLAAPQVGKSLQLFIIKESPKDPLLVFINPELTIPKGQSLPTDNEKGERKEVKIEGCLSLQDVWGVVNRYPEIGLTSRTRRVNLIPNILTGFWQRSSNTSMIICREFFSAS